MNTPWPTHPNGEPMRLGEMSMEQRRHHTRVAIKKVCAEIQRSAPAIGAVLQTIDAVDKAKASATAAYARAKLSSTPAWPMFEHARPAPQHFDSLWCSEDNSIRVAQWQGRFYVSIKGDNFAGPFRTEIEAKQYGGAK